MDQKKLQALLEAQQLISEAGRMISGKNAKTLQDAFKTIQTAMEQLGVLLSDENEEIVNEANGTTTKTNIPVWHRWNFEEASKILAQDDSFDARRQAVQSALRVKLQNEMLAKKVAANYVGDEYYYDYCYPYIRDLYEDYVVYTVKSELFQASYTISSDAVTIGDTTPVKISYVPTSSAAQESQNGVIDLQGELIELKERAVREDGTVNIKIISPGWGSSGYYSEKVLKRDGPKIFKKGLHMYINHPTDEEDSSRPERDLRDLAGVLESDPKWEDNGSTGPGLYAQAKVFDGFRQFIDEAAPYIGTSIRASGRAQEGEAEGKYGMIIDSLVEGHSVDYVTLPGRGGAVLPLLEAHRNKHDRRDQKSLQETIDHNHTLEIEENQVDEEKVKALITESMKPVVEENATLRTQLQEANTSVARMSEALIIRDAREIVSGVLAGLDLPDMTRARLAESCSKNPPVKDGVLDTAILVESTKTAATEEMKYLESVAGVTGGKPVGMGTTVTQFTNEDANKALEEAFASLGFDEKSVKIAANGRG